MKYSFSGKNIEWRYKDSVTSGSSWASAKALRTYMDGNVELAAAVYGTQAAVVVLKVQDGSVFKKKVLSDELGQIGDIEPFTGTDNTCQGYAITGHSTKEVPSGSDGCTSAQGCNDIRGGIHILDCNLQLKKSTYFDGYKGGLYQYAGISKGYGTLIHTECWGLAKAYDTNGLHDGFISGCGNGIEECPVSGFSNAAKQWCQSDPRKAWRSLLVKVNLEGNIVWYRQDNFWSGEENPVTSASEYVITTGNAIVSVNDELFGIGLQRVE